MKPLRYPINVTLDGCCHHEVGQAVERLKPESGEGLWVGGCKRRQPLDGD
jgi:hypothetical protein